MKQKFENFRPKGFVGKGDSYLPSLIKELEKCISEIEANYNYDTLRLDKNQKNIFSSLIIEFAEDLHNDIGLWRSIENYNNELFNSPLPLFVKNKNEITDIFDKNRIKYFIHTIFFEFDPELIIAPDHLDLETLAECIEVFLKNAFKKVPKDSGLKKFLMQSNECCWEFKQKLVWVGSKTYLFRYSCYRYASEINKGKLEIAIIDDFICQENTIWSGLGVIDILAKAVEVSEKIQNDIRTWYERLIAYYRVISINNNILELENIISENRYEVYLEIDKNPFKTDTLILGGIVPYGKYWYWSGVQHDCGKIKDENAIIKIKNDFTRNASRIVYRYDKKLLNRATEDIKTHYTDFIEYFGNDLVVFKDGLSMAAALQTKGRQKFEALPKEELQKTMKKHKLKDPYPRMNIPDSILDADDGIAVFFNKDEGSEIMTDFDNVMNGFKKQGNNLTVDEAESIRNFIYSEAISPNFVFKMIKDYGGKSIQSSFLLNPEDNNIDYLLHKYKGHFFRNRYPEISYAND